MIETGREIIIDLRSDTVTKPSPSMREAMMGAQLGDDVLEGDPTTGELEAYCSKLFQMEKALFCPSGTMTNQIALCLWAHKPLSEVIIEEDSHVYQYEVGGLAWNSRAQIKAFKDPKGEGKLCPKLLRKYLKDSGFPSLHKAEPALVSIENSTNRGGGACYTLEEIKALYEVCQEFHLKFHLDGARIFNALAVTGNTPDEIGKYFDSISICLSKGLGAPLGSVLLIKKDEHGSYFLAKKLRKVMGGAMRQSGLVAASGLHALKNHLPLLLKDHERAQILGQALKDLSYVSKVLKTQTNILIFELSPSVFPENYLSFLKKNNILATSFGGQLIRFVTHYDFTDEMLDKTLEIIKGFSS